MVPDSESFSLQQLIKVSLNDRSYEIDIAPEALGGITESLARWTAEKSPGTVLIVTDGHLADTHAPRVAQALEDAGWRVATHVIPAGESSKSFGVVETIYDALVALRADRKAILLALGGGVVGDTGGFAAATYNRGIRLVQVPTSLLAMVDSSVGGKVGINHPRGKNLIGAFHQPQGVLIDTRFLDTLSDREFRSGLAEVVKYGVIRDADFFASLENNATQIRDREEESLIRIISRSCEIKAEIVALDEFETSGLRASLNYGHTFAHAYEALAGYGNLTHGEAVSIGMVHASCLAERRGLISADVTRRQLELLTALELPTSLPADLNFDPDDVLDRMRLDKKNAGGKLRFILPVRLGEVRLFDDVPEADVRAVL